MLVLLVLAELALRRFAPSLDVPFVTEVQYAGTSWYQINRRYLEKYFPAGTILLPELKPNIMRKEKTPSVFRVVCLGESSMFGVPYQMTANIPGLLRKQLRHLFPGREIEVINMGASAVNSNVLADLVPEVATLKPDVVLLYCGHNEFYGPDAFGASFLEKHFPALTRLKYHLRDLRLVRLFQRFLHRKLAEKSASTEQNLMQEVSAGAHVYPGSADEARVFAMTERNLESIISQCREDHIPLIVSDVSSNLMFPPFAFDTLSGYSGVSSAFHNRDYRACFDLARTLLLSDSTNAFLHYWCGRASLELGMKSLAEWHLQRADDYDLLRFRAPGRTNQTITRVCRRENVPFVSTDSLFRANSPDGIPGPGLFWEHVHPTLRGYYMIANLYLEKMASLHLLPGTPEQARLLPLDPDSLSVCWLDQAYGDVTMYALTTRWPFNNYHYTPAVISSADNELRLIVLDVYNKRIGWEEGCVRSAGYFEKRSMWRQALTTYAAMIEEFPLDSYPHYLAAVVLKQSGQIPQAIAEYETSIRSDPQYPNAHVDLGLLEINRGNFDAAIQQFTTALDIISDRTGNTLMRATIDYGLSAAYANKGDFGKAVEYINESVRLVPSYVAAQELRQKLLNRR